MKLLTRGDINAKIFDVVEKYKAKCKVMNYNWNNDVLIFQDLVVHRPKERNENVNLIHEEIGYFNEQRTLVEVKKRYLWHDKLNQ
jgi:hypothetical protein